MQGYRIELPDERLEAEFNDDSTFVLTPEYIGPTRTRNEGIIGEGVDLDLEHLRDLRPSTLVYHLHPPVAGDEVGATRAGSPSSTSSGS